MRQVFLLSVAMSVLSSAYAHECEPGEQKVLMSVRFLGASEVRVALDGQRCDSNAIPNRQWTEAHPYPLPGFPLYELAPAERCFRGLRPQNKLSSFIPSLINFSEEDRRRRQLESALRQAALGESNQVQLAMRAAGPGLQESMTRHLERLTQRLELRPVACPQ